MGLHSERLAAKNAHRRCVTGAKLAFQKLVLQKMGRKIPGPGDIRAEIVGAEPLPFPVPPMLEEALGYRGILRFLAFGYNSRTRHFCFCDGGDDIPVDHEPWFTFLRHPLVNHHLPKKRYPYLYGVFTNGDDAQQIPSLLLDRDEQQAYICRRDRLFLLFALAEPEDGDHHTVFVDGLLMSPGSEEYKVPTQPETLQKLREFLDESLRLNTSPSISSETSG